MKRILIVFSLFAVMLSLGISIGAPPFVKMNQLFVGEDNPKNQIWLKTDDKDAIANNSFCDKNENKAPDPRIPRSRICTVKYLNDEERKLYELKYKSDNKFYLGDEKEPYDSGKAIEIALASKKYAIYTGTAETEERWGVWPAIWVMDRTSTLYVSSTPQPGIFNHSSLVAGDSVVCAGEILVVNGVIKRISNSSGHYRPPDKALQNALDELVKQGVKLDDDLKIDWRVSRKMTRFGDKKAPSDAAIPNKVPHNIYFKPYNIYFKP